MLEFRIQQQNLDALGTGHGRDVTGEDTVAVEGTLTDGMFVFLRPAIIQPRIIVDAWVRARKRTLVIHRTQPPTDPEAAEFGR